MHTLGLEFSSSAVAPLPKEVLLVWVITADTAFAVATALVVRDHAATAENTAAGGLDPVDPVRPAGGLVGSRISDHALHAGCSTAVEARRGEMDVDASAPGVQGGHAHGGVDLAGAVLVLFVLAVVGGFPGSVVTVLGVDSIVLVSAVLCEEGSKLFLGWSGIGHGGGKGGRAIGGEADTKINIG